MRVVSDFRVTLECEVCSQPFEAKSRKAKYCSQVCRSSANYKRNGFYFMGTNQKQRAEMRAAQDYRCAICNRHEDELGEILALDHDHETDALRKMLCRPCNSAIGLLQDNPEIALQAFLYLEAYRG